MHPVCNYCKKCGKETNALYSGYKVMFGEYPTHHSYYSYVQAWWWLHHVMGMFIIGKGVFGDKNKWNRAKHGENPRGKPVPVCFPTDARRH
jgi:hypothetical protein